jgi:hypothetical protein
LAASSFPFTALPLGHLRIQLGDQLIAKATYLRFTPAQLVSISTLILTAHLLDQ